ncbi:MAG: hypothetical protein HUU55_01785 [Myxococcales bacterium]|nr:hypothetical protein [Myxococcales bacterium]
MRTVISLFEIRLCLHVVWTAVVMTSLGCAADAPLDYGDPTYSVGDVLQMTVVTPADYADMPSSNIEVRVRLDNLTEGTTKVTIRPTGGAPSPCEMSGGEWVCRTNVLHGVSTLDLLAYLSDGRQIKRVHHVQYHAEAPGILVFSPGHKTTVGKNPVTVAGKVSAPMFQSVEQVEVRAGEHAPAKATLFDDGSFTVEVNLPSATGVPLWIEARSNGLLTTTQLWVTQDPIAPTLCLTQPASTVRLSESTGTLKIAGQVLDNTGVSSVSVGWADDELSNVKVAADGTFVTEVALGAGTQTLLVYAIDLGGNIAEKTISVSTPFETVLTATNQDLDNTFTLTLGVDDLKALIGTADQRDLVLFMLDMEDIVGAAIDAMLDPIAFGLSPDRWDVASQNLLGILQMTPETVELSGTVLAEMTQLAKALGIPVPSMFGKLLNIPITQRFLTRQQLLAAVLENLVKPHPNIVLDPETGRPTLPVTMYDAFENMAPLNEKLGAVGTHPGLVAPGQVYSEVLTDAFSMELTATSNLVVRDGIDLGVGKSYLFQKSARDVLSFDFNDEKQFKMIGVKDYPAVNMVFQMVESPSFVPAGKVQNAGCFFENGEEFCRGDSPVWQLDTWSLEYVIADAAFGAFRGLYNDSDPPYVNGFSYDIGEVKNAAKVDWNKGWISIVTESNVGDPPPPSYLWDTLLEVAQIRLHDGEIPEGTANALIPLPSVYVPLSGEDVAAKVRPMLSKQASKLSYILAGDHSDYQTLCDIYLVVDPQTDDPVLWFVGDYDVAQGSKKYPKTGFFSDAAFLNSIGDHFTAKENAEVFVMDESGDSFRLTVVAVGKTGVTIRVGALTDQGLTVSGGGCQ